MALPVERRGVPGCGRWGPGSTGGLPGLWPADGVLVGLSAVCAPRPCVAGVGVRPLAAGLGVPHTAVRDWWRRLGVRAPVLVAGLCALLVELGGLVDGLPGVAERAALAALGALAARVRQRLGEATAGWGRPGGLATGGDRQRRRVAGRHHEPALGRAWGMALAAARAPTPTLIGGGRAHHLPVRLGRSRRAGRPVPLSGDRRAGQPTADRGRAWPDRPRARLPGQGPGRAATPAARRCWRGPPLPRAIERGGSAAGRAARPLGGPHRRHPACPLWDRGQPADHPLPPAPQGPGSGLPWRPARPGVRPLRGRAAQPALDRREVPPISQVPRQRPDAPSITDTSMGASTDRGLQDTLTRTHRGVALTHGTSS